MKRAYLFLIILLPSTLTSLMATAQVKNKYSYSNIGVPITLDEFNRMVKEVLIIVRQGKALTTKEFITMVRIENTIHLNDAIRPNLRYRNFSKLFTAKYTDSIIQRMDTSFGVGMSYYSAKYKLYWGGKPDSNSMFKIVKPMPTIL